MKAYWILLLVIFMGSCEKAKFPSEYSKQLLGEWELEWVAKGGFGPLLSQDDLGETRQLRFKDNGRYHDCVDNKVKKRCDYHIISETQNEHLNVFMEGAESDQISIYFNETQDNQMDIYHIQYETSSYDIHRYNRK